MQKTLIRPDRVREILREGFIWLDRRLILKSFPLYLTDAELKLHFFLCLVGDSQGLSYCGWRRICRILRLSEGDLREAIGGLQRQDLIAFRWPLFQVLSLPERPVADRARAARLLAEAR